MNAGYGYIKLRLGDNMLPGDTWCWNCLCGKRPIDPGEGYEIVPLDDTIREGDEYLIGSNPWASNVPVGEKVSTYYNLSFCEPFAFRRKVKAL